MGDQGILVKDLSRIFNGEVRKTIIFSLNFLIAVFLSESRVKVVLLYGKGLGLRWPHNLPGK